MIKSSIGFNHGPPGPGAPSLPAAQISRTVPFTFRGIPFTFALSRGLFSSAGIDGGTRLLLGALSGLLDQDLAGGLVLPRSILDAGSGTGIIGICIAKALLALRPDMGPLVRAQDRDELARIFTLHNAAQNGLERETLEAYTEPLLASPAGAAWDLIVSNIPAKTGLPVLEDFVFRSARRLAQGGRALIVVVHTLAPLFRSWIAKAALPLLLDKSGGDHVVLAYGAPAEGTGEAAPVRRGDEFRGPGPGGFPPPLPGRPGPSPYFRKAGDQVLAGTGFRMEGFEGAPGFDSPGLGAELMAALVRRLYDRGLSVPGPVLIHEGDQGCFALWLRALGAQGELVLSGRNILALEASRHNLRAAGWEPRALVPAVDFELYGEALRSPLGGEPYRFIAALGEQAAWWEGLSGLLAQGGTALIALPARQAENLDRNKSRGFTRLGDIKRRGLRVLAYRLDGGPRTGG